jgi:hypothetical protein
VHADTRFISSTEPTDRKRLKRDSRVEGDETETDGRGPRGKPRLSSLEKVSHGNLKTTRFEVRQKNSTVHDDPLISRTEEEPVTKGEYVPAGGNKSFATFPEKLMAVLEDREVGDTIQWNSQGDAFGIVPETFNGQVLKKHFQGTKFESFTRKLNRWGFQRVVDNGFPNNVMVYRHEMFRKGTTDLVKKMKGIKKKNEPDLREQKLMLEQLSRDLQTSPNVPSYLRIGRSPPSLPLWSPPTSSMYAHPSFEDALQLTETDRQQLQQFGLYSNHALLGRRQHVDQTQQTLYMLGGHRLQEIQREQDVALLAAEQRLRLLRSRQEQLAGLAGNVGPIHVATSQAHSTLPMSINTGSVNFLTPGPSEAAVLQDMRLQDERLRHRYLLHQQRSNNLYQPDLRGG